MKVSCYESKRFVSSPLRWFKEAATFRPSPSHLPSQKKPNSSGKILASTNFIYSLYKVLSLTNSRMLNFATTFCKRLNVKELVTNVPVYGSIADGSAGGLSLMFRRWATKKTAGSTKNGRDSKPKNLGVKKFGGERVIPGNIIVRQRGTRFHPGDYVGIGKDHTLYALKEGRVKFEKHKLSGRKWVHVEPKEGHVLHPLYASDSSTQLEMAT